MPKELRLRALEIALTQVGVKERPSNRGKEVEEYQAEAGIHPGDPWCAAFVNWCARRAAAELGVTSALEAVPLQGYVQSYVDHGKQHGWVVKANEVKPGHLFCVYHPSLNRYAHIGFVGEMLPSRTHFTTVEGNANSQGGREGIEVARITRGVNDRILFLRWT